MTLRAADFSDTDMLVALQGVLDDLILSRVEELGFVASDIVSVGDTAPRGTVSVIYEVVNEGRDPRLFSEERDQIMRSIIEGAEPVIPSPQEEFQDYSLILRGLDSRVSRGVGGYRLVFNLAILFRPL